MIIRSLSATRLVGTNLGLSGTNLANFRLSRTILELRGVGLHYGVSQEYSWRVVKERSRTAAPAPLATDSVQSERAVRSISCSLTLTATSLERTKALANTPAAIVI